MIPNFVAYLRSKFVDVTFVAEAWNETSPINAVLVSDSGGQENHYSGRKDVTVQLLSRGQDLLKTKDVLERVYIGIANRFGLTLPEVNVGGATFPALKTYRIVPMQMPSYVGAFGDYHEYSFNLEVTLGYYRRQKV